MTDNPVWAMQIVANLVPGFEPTYEDLCETTATAVAKLLASPWAKDEWAEAIQQWKADGRSDGSSGEPSSLGLIRKHVRRARHIAWERALATGDHIQACSRDISRPAMVAAFVPCRMDELPKDLARLQMAGLELEHRDYARTGDIGNLEIDINPHAGLSAGKAAAAAAHAAQYALESLPGEDLRLWTQQGHPVRVRVPSSEHWEYSLEHNVAKVVDAGLTENTTGICTAVALGVDTFKPR